MAIRRRRQVQERLQQALDVTGVLQVLAADHLGDPALAIIDHRRQVIGDAQILARQDHVAGPPRVGGDLALARLDEGQAVKSAQSALGGADRQPPGERLARVQPPRLFGLAQRFAEIGRLGLVRRLADSRGHLGPGLEAAVQQAGLGQPGQRRRVAVQPPRLDDHRLVPDEAQPGQVLEDGGLELRPAAGGVDVLHAQQETAADGPGGVEGGQGGKRVPAMQQAGGGGGEAGDESRGRRAHASWRARAWRA